MIKNPETCSEKEREDLLKLCKAYPFSAVIKILNAKIASIEQSPELNNYITSAAITTVDRGNFHHYIRSDQWEISNLPSTRIEIQESETVISTSTDLEIESGIREKEEDTRLGKSVNERQTAAGEEILSGESELTKRKKESEEIDASSEPLESQEMKEVSKKAEIIPEMGIPETENAMTSETEWTEEPSKQKEDQEVTDIEEKTVETEPEEKVNPFKHITEEESASEDRKIKEEPPPIEDQTPDLPDQPEETSEGTISGKDVSDGQEKIKKEGYEEDSSEGDDLSDRDELAEELSSTPSESTQVRNTNPPDVQESKKSVSEETTDEEEPGPLASDLLRNIQEYRKNREFFEKILDDKKEPGVKSNLKTEKPQSFKEDQTREDSKSHKHKKDKKKKHVSAKGKKEDQSEVKKTETDSNQEVKKNSGKKNRKTAEEVEEIPVSPDKTEKKASTSEKSLEESPGRKYRSKEENISAEENMSPTSGKEYEIPSEIPNEDTIEKVTENQKSEGYEVNEEEDPSVIKEFLEKISPGSEEFLPPKKLKKEEQEEIIEQFIKTEPKIKNIKTAQALREREDLSATSVKFKDDVVSENLANILKNQGKTEQAIDIYKKLIWKFPQKKAYFASQIDELKKKLGK